MIHDRYTGNKVLSSSSSLLLPLLLVVPYCAAGHDIPQDVAVQAFVKPLSGVDNKGQRLHLLVRVPLGSMRDVDFPEREGGYLDAVKLAPLLPDAAILWISDFIKIYEGPAQLPKPRVVGIQVS